MAKEEADGDDNVNSNNKDLEKGDNKEEAEVVEEGDAPAATTTPTLFEECVGLWGGSVVSPTTTNLRIMARKGLLSSPEEAQTMLNLPLKISDMMEIFTNNKDTMSKEFEHDPGIPFHIKVVGLYKEQFKLGHEQQIVVFDDENVETELVYGIIVNAKRKMTTLTFRGSVTKRDYEADANIVMKWMVDSDGNNIRVHKGIADYLFEIPKSSEEDPSNNNNNNEKKEKKEKKEGEDKNEPTSSKYDTLVQNLKRVYDEYPDHQLRITGHSLGGSLAILATFRLATEPCLQNSIPFPIKTLGFGAMLVGDLRFLRSFQKLENDGKICCVVLLNAHDIIPLLPVFSGWALYRSVGKQITLSGPKEEENPTEEEGQQQQQQRNNPNNKPPEIYTPAQGCFPAGWTEVSVPGFHVLQFMYILGCKRKFWLNHTVSTTMRNIIASEYHLRQMTMEGLYEKEGK